MCEKMIKFFGLFLSVLWIALPASSVTAQEAKTAAELIHLLPKDGATVDVLQLAPSPRSTELAKKLQNAAAKDPDWWKSHVSKAKMGQPLPYDAKMGLTKEEYQEFLDLSKKRSLTKVKSVKVNVKRGDNLATLTFGNALPGLSEAIINLKDDSVKTPFGVTDTRNAVVADPGQRVTGPWDGTEWRLEQGSPTTGELTIVKFAIGKLKDTGRGILYYDVNQTSKGARVRHQYILQYDLKPTP